MVGLLGGSFEKSPGQKYHSLLSPEQHATTASGFKFDFPEHVLCKITKKGGQPAVCPPPPKPLRPSGIWDGGRWASEEGPGGERGVGGMQKGVDLLCGSLVRGPRTREIEAPDAEGPSPDLWGIRVRHWILYEDNGEMSEDETV